VAGRASVAAMFWKRRICGSVLAAVLVSTGCSATPSGPARPAGSVAAPGATTAPVSQQATSPAPSASPSPSRTPPALPLAGEIVGIDPGHNGRNGADPDFIDRQIWNGRELENCDTTGTETMSGYTEAHYNFNVARYLSADLRADGARVVMTRSSNDGVGPCVTTRAQIIDRSHANVAIDIHADGGPPSGRGFTVLEPVADGTNDKVIRSSIRFGSDVKAALLADTTMPTSDYYGVGGVIFRDDLAGLNLTTVPKVLIECGNMRNATDAALLVRPGFQRQVARALTAAIIAFLRR
jgi:N-acetylmuramoyl-L-alanine amidase